jgi:hypothetical protein
MVKISSLAFHQSEWNGVQILQILVSIELSLFDLSSGSLEDDTHRLFFIYLAQSLTNVNSLFSESLSEAIGGNCWTSWLCEVLDTRANSRLTKKLNRRS